MHVNNAQFGKCQKVGAENYALSLSDGVGFLSCTGEQFDYVFIDPPYASEPGKNCLQVVARALNQGGVAIYESEKPFDEDVDGLILTDRRKYGRAHLTFFVKK